MVRNEMKVMGSRNETENESCGADLVQHWGLAGSARRTCLQGYALFFAGHLCHATVFLRNDLIRFTFPVCLPAEFGIPRSKEIN